MTQDVELPVTLPVRTFCRAAYGIGEVGAYAAARSNEVPTIRVGGLIKVPVRVALAKIANGDPEILRAVTADFAAKLSQMKAEQAA
ncbi:hypothetical protein [Bradyrhizobium sp. USDA 4486]